MVRAGLALNDEVGMVNEATFRWDFVIRRPERDFQCDHSV
jgi:hypothetical protein